MNKLIMAIVVSAAVASLAACGGGGSDSSNNAASTGSAVAASDTSSSSSNTKGTGSTITTPATPSSGYNGTASGGASTGSGVSTAPAPSNTATPTPTPSGNNSLPAPPVAAVAMTCSIAGTSAASSSALITVDTPSSNGAKLFQKGESFNIVISAAPSSADTLNWSVFDTVGNTVATGSVPIAAGGNTVTLSCKSTLAGYFAITASLAKAGGQVPTKGTRPNGFASFGVIPDISAVLPTPTFSSQDQHRFGMQGFNDNAALLNALGITQTIDDRQMSLTEPNARNTFNPQTYAGDSFYNSGSIMRLVRLDGVPAWLSSTGDVSYGNLPTDIAYYQDYMGRVGTNTELIRSKYFPKQSANYYQVTWEPDVQWKGTDADFVALYKAAYAGLHSTDSKAVVMGPTDSFPQNTLARLKKLAPLGFKNYIDGVATHGYYDAGTMPSHPPERHATDADPADQANALNYSIRNLRQEMASEYKTGMKLFVTETGISYDLGSSYGPNYPTPNILFAQGAVVARAHIIMLGEGADVTYPFFGPDYNGEVGYGTFFNLENAQGSFGASDISPKPAAMAIAAMSRVLDGTTTLGPVRSTPAGVYAYAFQQLGGGKVIQAVWTHNNAVWDASVGFSTTYSKAYQLQVDAAGTSGTVQVIDMMGNVSNMNYTDGKLAINLTESPVYIVSNNASVVAANATKPAGMN